ncbi:MAG: nuclear transport factor 2 family protein [Pirellula sp.]
MKRVLLVLTAILFVPLAMLYAAAPQKSLPSNPELANVQAADDLRVAAMKSPDRSKLEASFSDDLRYAHSNGVVDTKSSLIDILTAGKTKYVGYEYQERSFTFPAPGIALMAGRAHVQAKTGEATMDSVLSYLAVWRNENGKWRFMAWQSCRLPVPDK